MFITSTFQFVSYIGNHSNAFNACFKKYILKKCALFGVSVFNLCICFHDTDHTVSYLLFPSSVLVPSTKKDMAAQASIHVWKTP